MSWPGSGDPYFTDEGDVRRNFYSINSVPRTEIDGNFDDNPSNMVQSDLDIQYAIAPSVDLQAYYQVNEATQTVDVQVDMEALVDLAPGSRLFVAIFEYKTFNNVGSNGETEFEHVMKKMMPSSTGTVISPMTTGESVHYDFTHVFQGSYFLPADANDPIDHAIEHSIEEFSDLGIVVWYQKMSGHDVYQAAYGIPGFNPLAVDENEAIIAAKIYPNPAANNAAIAFHTQEAQDVSIDVYSALGQLVHSATLENVKIGRTVYDLNTESLYNGMYTVKISSDQGSLSKRLIVQK